MTTTLLIEIFEKNKFEEYKEENPENASVLNLIKFGRENKILDENINIIWPEILYQIICFEKISKNVIELFCC